MAGAEIETLLGALDRNRRTFAWKCFGLSAEEMRRTLGPSTMTLAGLVKHVALVEDYYFSLGLEVSTCPRRGPTVDFDADPDWDWHSAADDSPEELQALWEAAAGRSRAAVAAFLTEGGPDSRVKYDRVDRATQPAPDAGRHGRGVRAAHRSRRPDPRVHRRPGRGRTAPRVRQ